MAWFVEKTQDWGGDEGPALLIHDGGDSTSVPVAELETVSELGYFDAKDLLQFIIRSGREKQSSN